MKFYHATHRSLVPRILREGLKPKAWHSFIYLARTPEDALFQAGDDLPLKSWKLEDITEFEPSKDLVVLEISGLDKRDFSLADESQWEGDEDLAVRKTISPKQIRLVRGSE